MSKPAGEAADLEKAQRRLEVARQQLTSLSNANAALRGEVRDLRRQLEAYEAREAVVVGEAKQQRGGSASAEQVDPTTSKLKFELLQAGTYDFPGEPQAIINQEAAHSPHGDKNPLCVCAVHHNSSLVVTGGADKAFVVTDWKAQRRVGSCHLPAPVLCVRNFPLLPAAFTSSSGNNDTLVCLAGLMNGECHVVEVKLNTGISRSVLHWRDHDSYVLSLDVDGKMRTASSSRDKSCIVSRVEYDADTNTWSRVKLQPFYFQGAVEAVTFVDSTAHGCEEDLLVSERGSCYLVFCNVEKNTRRQWNVNERGDEHVSFTVLSMEPSSCGRFILCSTDKHRIFVIANGCILRNFYGHTADEMSTPRAVWHPSNKYVFGNSQKDCDIHAWCVASERSRAKLEGHGRSVRGLAHHPTANILFTISYDHSLRVWQTGEVEAPGDSRGVIVGENQPASKNDDDVDSASTEALSVEECVRQLQAAEGAVSSAIQTSDPAQIKSAKRQLRQSKKRLKIATAQKKASDQRAADVAAKQEIAKLEADPLVTLISDPSDTRVAAYMNLKDASSTSREGRFIAEGPEALRILLRSPRRIDSLFVKPTIYEKLHADIVGRSEPVTVYVAPFRVMGKVVGYPVRRGALACGHVPDPIPLRDFCSALSQVVQRRQWRFLAADGSNNHANVGSLIRTGSAMGCRAVLLSGDCCDPWYRHAVRVSMGHIFNMPLVRCTDLAADLRFLRDEHGVVSFGAVIDTDALKLQDLPSPSPDRWLMVVGSEDKGISEQVRSACDHLVRIDMYPGVDSLAITVAAGIAVNGVREREKPESAW